MSFHFPPFRLELSSEQLWRADDVIALRPKTFAVLRYLVEHPEKLVTKDELLDAVWAGTVVSDTVLKSCIRELRLALADDIQTPQFIATVHRRGYRFIGPLSNLLGQTEPPTETAPRQKVDEERKVTRKLAAILSADVQGYSRLMGQDEAGTIRTLTTYRAVMTALIAQHGGRVVDTPGDNLLAEFASAVDAVQCAVVIQQALGAKNTALPSEQQMVFRIGINVGDVVVEGERLYGEGVNIAARLEGLAKPGGLCISGTVYDQVKTKVALSYEDLGKQTVKNIAEPVRVYRVTWEAEGEATSAQAATPTVVSSRLQVSGPRTPKHQQPHGTLNVERGTLLVGRESELMQLQAWLNKALNGERHLVFVTGEPGIGKTTLVDAFLSGIGQQGSENGKQANQKAKGKKQKAKVEEPAPSTQHLAPGVWVAWGQCIEQYGAGEAYMPILEALGRLCRAPGGDQLIALLNHHAPTWLVQMPTLLNATELETLQRKVHGATRERMLREMAEAIDIITAEQPLVLWLEDLHWSDPSTLELLSLLARRRESARLLILGTYRPVDVIVSEHPLRAVKQELQLHGHCHELAVRLLREEAIEKYLAARVQVPSPAQAEEGQDEGLSARALATLARTIHQRTEGNPLFMVNVVDSLLVQGVETRHVASLQHLEELDIGVPENLQQLIEQHLERLRPEEQRLLEVASVAGMEFSAATVAAGADVAIDESEEHCASLARRGQFLQATGTAEWPDGTISTRYGFQHVLYQEVAYERIPLGRCISLHKRIGERIETAYGKQASEIAAELAVHFEQGRDYQRAVLHLRRAAQNALRRSAHQEAVSLLTKGLEFLRTLPGAAEDIQQELRMQLTLGTALIALKGIGAPEVEKAYARAYDLCQQAGEAAWLFPALGGLFAFYHERGELKTARDLAEQLLPLAQREHNPVRLVWAHCALGETLRYTGDLLLSRAHLEQSLMFYTPQPDHSYGFVYNPQVLCLSTSVLVLHQLGYSEQALQRSKQALIVAQELAHPYSLVIALNFAALVHRLRGELRTAYEFDEAKTALARGEGFPYYVAYGMIMKGWYLVEQGQGE